ncbi:MAG TPA: hypothetical protein VIV60_35410 [Polyangiaceae bacterium]
MTTLLKRGVIRSFAIIAGTIALGAGPNCCGRPAVVQSMRHDATDRHPVSGEWRSTTAAASVNPLSANDASVPQGPNPAVSESACGAALGQLTVEPTVTRMAMELAQLQRQLLHEAVVDVETQPHDVRVSSVMREVLPQLKQHSREIVRQLIAAFPTAMPDCDGSITQRIIAILKSSGVTMSDESAEVGALAVQIELVDAVPPRRWFVALAFTLPCGDDGSVYVFEQNDKETTLAIAVESNGYSSLRQAQLGAVGKLSPIDPAGRWFLVTTHGQAWCTSTWLGLRYRVFERGPTFDHPVLLLDERSTANWNGDGGAEIQTSADGFSLRFVSWDRMSGDITRPHIRKYLRKGSHFERVQPFVARARDLPDEWVQLPWSSASALCASGTQGTLRQWHQRLASAVKTEPIVFEKQTPDTDAARMQVTFACKGCRLLADQFTFALVMHDAGHRIASITSNYPSP